VSAARPSAEAPAPRAGAPPEAPLLAVRHATKSYDGERALIDVALDLRAGEVHALMGENGAGKSTLIRLLAGVEPADAMAVTILGRSVAIRSPADAARLGLRFIHQELNVVPALSVAENIFLGHAYPTTPIGTISWARLRQRALRALGELGVTHVDPSLPMSRASTGDAMLASIARAFVETPGGGDVGRVYVMDEPTAALSRRETELLFDVVRRLRSRGAAVLYVSHRIEEIFELADRITVLRDGRVAAAVPVEEATREDLILAMTGRTLAAALARESAVGGGGPDAEAAGGEATDAGLTGAEGVLAAHDLRTAVLRGVSLRLRAGEVVGVTGLAGAGKTELLRALIGADPLQSGQVAVGARVLHDHHPATAWAAGMAFVPEERRAQGLAMAASVRRNLMLPHLAHVSHAGFADGRRERHETERWSARVGLRARGAWQSVHELSGGNQQKVLLARALAGTPAVLLLDEPTRGVDVGAKADIYALVRGAAADGAAVLLASSDLDEVLATCDRVLVLYQGRLVAERPVQELDRASLLALCYGDAA
jgi:ABC-type sugar transport system ATPase subunit